MASSILHRSQTMASLRDRPLVLLFMVEHLMLNKTRRKLRLVQVF